MRLRDGSVFPRDYAPQDLGGGKYRTPEGEIGAWRAVPNAARRTAAIEHDPAYRVLRRAVEIYDLQIPRDRQEFAAVLVAASFYDAYGYVHEISQRVSAHLLALDRLADADDFSARLDALEQKIEQIAKILGDSVSGALDARERGGQAFEEVSDDGGSPVETP